MTDTSDLARRTEHVLEKYGLDLCEYFLLDHARLESPAPRHLFAGFAKNLSDGDPRGEFTLEQYEEGLERLLTRGLLVVVTPSEIKAELARHRQAGIPTPWSSEYRGIDVDFSQEGFDVNNAILRELWGQEFLEHPRTTCDVDSVSQRIFVYSTSAYDCQNKMREFLNRDQDPPYFGKSKRQYTVAQHPSPFGAWSPKRFITIPRGFRGILTYTD